MENSCFRRDVGTRGRTEPEETSDRTVEPLSGTGTTCSEGLVSMASTDGHGSCKGGMAENLKSGEEI